MVVNNWMLLLCMCAAKYINYIHSVPILYIDGDLVIDIVVSVIISLAMIVVVVAIIIALLLVAKKNK